MKRVHVALLLVALLFSAGCVLAVRRSSETTTDGGAGHWPDLAQQTTIYLQALHDRDMTAVRQLVSPEWDPSVPLAQRLERYGGIDVRSVTRSWSTTPVSRAPVVTLTSANAAYQDSLTWSKIDGRWYIAMGCYKRAPGRAGWLRPNDRLCAPNG